MAAELERDTAGNPFFLLEMARHLSELGAFDRDGARLDDVPESVRDMVGWRVQRVSGVSEDGVLPDWFLKPHPRFGTSSRMINLVVVLQVITIVCSRGDVLALGEAYAFGVIWSFVFMSLSILILRFKRPASASTRCRSTSGSGDSTFRWASRDLHGSGGRGDRQPAYEGGGDDHRRGVHGRILRRVLGERAHPPPQSWKSPQSHEHLEQFNQKQAEQLSVESLNVTKPYRKLVAIRSPFNLAMLERCLDETDPETTEVVVMTATVLPLGSGDLEPMITVRDRQLLTAVVNLAEHAGKPVKPVIIPTNEPFFAMAARPRRSAPRN